MILMMILMKVGVGTEDRSQTLFWYEGASWKRYGRDTKTIRKALLEISDSSFRREFIVKMVVYDETMNKYDFS